MSWLARCRQNAVAGCTTQGTRRVADMIGGPLSPASATPAPQPRGGEVVSGVPEPCALSAAAGRPRTGRRRRRQSHRTCRGGRVNWTGDLSGQPVRTASGARNASLGVSGSPEAVGTPRALLDGHAKATTPMAQCPRTGPDRWIGSVRPSVKDPGRDVRFERCICNSRQ